jgi:probable biosynthetic protein (TIGR04098 family)
VKLNSAFVTRAGDNKSLAKSAPRGMERAQSQSLARVPPFGEQYQLVKLRTISGQTLVPGPLVGLAGEEFHGTDDVVFATEHEINPYHDLNGVSLLYFASYHRIHDLCERLYMNRRPDADTAGDWALRAATIARDVFYYGNANCGERLLFRLHTCQAISGRRFKFHSALYRAEDGARIADIFTVKHVIEPDRG